MSNKTAAKNRGSKRVPKPGRRNTPAAPIGASIGAVDLDYEDTKPLTPAMAAAWDRAKRGRGRPRIGEGAEKVLISMERRLLLVTDSLAKRKGLDRSKLIALAIRQLLEREAESAAATGSRAVTAVSA